MDNEHVIGIVIETDNDIILSLKDLKKNNDMVHGTDQQSVRLTDSQLSLSIFRFIFAEVLPSSAILQQALCDTIIDRKISISPVEVDNLRNRTVSCCKPSRPVLNESQNINLHRDALRITTGRLLQHDNYIKPEVFQFSGTLRFYRVAKLNISDKYVFLPYISSSYKHTDFLSLLRSLCSKRTFAIVLSEDSKQPLYYHVILVFQSAKEATHFIANFTGELVSDQDDKNFNTVGENGDSDKVIRYKITPISLRFLNSVPHVEHIDAADILEIPTCIRCLACLDESVMNWKYAPFSLLQSTLNHCVGCLACVAASYTHSHCSACKETEDLWLCMICGNVACSRYKLSHGIKHCSSTGHSLTVNLNSFKSDHPFIWNYASDKCVQRLVPLSLSNNTNEKSELLIENKNIVSNEGLDILYHCEQVKNMEVRDNVEDKIVELGQSQNINVEKKAVTILELNALYTSAIEHVDNINNIIVRDLQNTYTTEINQLRKEIDHLNQRWKNVGGEKGASKKMHKRQDQLKLLDKNIEEEAELHKCLMNNLNEKTKLLDEKRAKQKIAQHRLQELSVIATDLMTKLT